MTELDLFYKHLPDIAAMVGNLQGKTPEQRQQWKAECLKYAGSISPFIHGFFRKTFIVIDAYYKETEEGRQNPGGIIKGGSLAAGQTSADRFPDKFEIKTPVHICRNLT